MNADVSALVTALVVLAGTFAFWGAWALSIRSFAQVPQEPGARVVLSGGFIVSAAFFLVLMRSEAGLAVVLTSLGVGFLAAWGVYWGTTGRFLGWWSSGLGRSLVLGFAGLLIAGGLLEAVTPSASASTAEHAYSRYCEYCESRAVFRELSALQQGGADLASAWVSWRPTVADNLQPSNAWSNLIFVLVGLLAAAARPKEPLAWAFMINSTFLGFGSFLFHASVRSGILQDLDVAGIYGALLAVFVYGLERIMARGAPWPFWLKIVIAVVVVAMSPVFVAIKEPLDAIGSEGMMGIFGGCLLILSVVFLGVTFSDWKEPDQRIVGHPATHEATTMAMPLVVLVSAIVLRTQDTTTEDLALLPGGCPVPTDYGSGWWGVLMLFLMLATFALIMGLVHLWAIRGRTSSSWPDWWGAAFVPFFGVLLLSLFTIPFLAPVSCCEESEVAFNGHAWWHVLAGTALYLQWRYYDHHTPNNTGDLAL